MEKFKVMIVDDEVDFLETIVKRLKARSIDVNGWKAAPRPWPRWRAAPLM